MHSVPRSERRKADHYELTSAAGLSIDLVGSCVDVSGDIYTGFGVLDRVGDQILRTSVQLRYSIKPLNASFAPISQVNRVSLIWLHNEPPGGWAALTPSYFFGSSSPPWQGFPTDEESHNFDILYDELSTLSVPSAPVGVPATYFSRSLYFELEGCVSRYAGPLPSSQTSGFLYLLLAASNGGGGLPFAAIDFNLQSKFKIKPFD